jgi:putative flippase GtrA
MRDGWRALYCILKYNVPYAPMVVQFAFYVLVGGLAAIVNLLLFMGFLAAGIGVSPAALGAFVLAAFVNYYLSIKFVFRHNARWQTLAELVVFLGVVAAVGIVDMACTRFFIASGLPPWLSKLLATAIGLVLNFAGRRFIVFPDKKRSDWRPQNIDRR